MIDFNRWIYSKDIAAWLAKNVSLNLEEQIDCICAAPHRTLEEKLEGLKELGSEYDKGLLQDRIESMNAVLYHSRSDTVRHLYLFGIEIFCRGEKDIFGETVLFRTAKEAADGICYYIEKAAVKEHLDSRNWYGVVRVFQKSGSFPHGFTPIKNMIVRYDGEVVYVQNTYSNDGCKTPKEIDMGYFDAIKLPYPSGTIISVSENPYIPELKGILVNTTEPNEEGFKDDHYNQWLIYPTLGHSDQTHGIGFVNLGDDNIPFGNNLDFVFPYKQMFDVYRDDLDKNEAWLSEMSTLIKMDKSCIRKILHDREPRNCRYKSMNEERLEYVSKLAAK